MDFWSYFWLLVWWFFFIAYLMVLFQVIADLFRDKELSGWWKAIWIVVFILIPFLGLLIYLIARGSGMAQRNMAMQREAKQATDQYIQSVAATASPAEHIASAKALLDNGTINQAEFEQLKAKALA